jgi:hypothetical protein
LALCQVHVSPLRYNEPMTLDDPLLEAPRIFTQASTAQCCLFSITWQQDVLCIRGLFLTVWRNERRQNGNPCSWTSRMLHWCVHLFEGKESPRIYYWCARIFITSTYNNSNSWLTADIYISPHSRGAELTLEAILVHAGGIGNNYTHL